LVQVVPLQVRLELEQEQTDQIQYFQQLHLQGVELVVVDLLQMVQLEDLVVEVLD
jgi:hypothetical protein